MKISTISCFLLLTASFSLINAQKSYLIEEYESNIQDVINAKDIVYYGIDFSKTVLTDRSIFLDNEKSRKYYASWIAYFETLIKPEDIVVKLLKKKDNIRYNPVSVQQRYLGFKHKWISASDYSFNIDTLKSVVKSYQLKESSGLGFVINVENFNKESSYLTVYFTFFNISSRDILWSVKIKGKPGGDGVSSTWAEGIYNSLMIYIKKVYEKKTDT